MTGNEDILLSAHDASQQLTITVKRWETNIESSLGGGGGGGGGIAKIVIYVWGRRT